MHAEERIRLFKVAMSPSLYETHSYTAAPHLNPLQQVLASGYIGQGPRVEEFEDALQKKLALPERPVTTNSCTSALDLALELIGVGPGDKVITTPQTCTATNSPIVTRRAIPVWADVNVHGLIDPASVRAAYVRHPDAKAIMAVDWSGRMADYGAIRRAVPGIPIIEDAAHRLPDGNVQGDYVAWSFQAIKFLTTGDGGALLTPQSQQARARLLRWYGLDRESSASFRCAQNIQEIGFKYHMNDIAAAIGLANLDLAQRNLALQRANAEYMAERLGIPFQEHSHYWFFPMSIKGNRDAFIRHCDALGIDAGQVHARNDAHDAFQRVSRPKWAGDGTDWFDAHQVAIPCGWWLTKADLDRVIAACLTY